VKRFGLGFLLGLATPALLGYFFVAQGGMPVAVKDRPLPFERFIARASLHAAFREALALSPPFKVNEAHLVEGAKTYRNNCLVCHGIESQSPTFIAQGLFPRPPQLFQPNGGVTDDPIGETYWKVKNGIRLTGMPGFEGNLSEENMWDVSLLLKEAGKLSERVKTTLMSNF